MSAPMLVCTANRNGWYTVTNDAKAYSQMMAKKCLRIISRRSRHRGAFDFWHDPREDVYEGAVTIGGDP